MNIFRLVTIVAAFLTSIAFSLEAEVVVLRAVKGRDARLPCGQGKVFLDGPDSYVLWLKNEHDFLYRFPNEDTSRRSRNRNRIFGMTCDSSGACHDDTSLLIKQVAEQDQGIYRCRVHYQASPSVDYVIDLRLVGTPIIYDEAGDEITKGFIGPITLGADFVLLCEVDDNQPDTMVYWHRNGVIVERAHVAEPGLLRAAVRVTNATRDELHAHYQCLARNSDVSEPLVASVVVKMYLPPMKVEIRLNNNLDFEAGQPRVVDCVVVGCVPPPSITWHLGTTLLRSNVHKELHDGNYTVSSLTLTTSVRDNKQDLICRAQNSHIPDTSFDDKVTINVGFRPVCHIGREEIIGAVVRDMESITCTVNSSPEPLQFSWTFAGSRILYTSAKNHTGHYHRYSSTLTWPPRNEDFGILFCRATNAFGEQKRPCTYNLVHGGPPSPPDCQMLRAKPSVLRVQCKKGWDGGRSQTIHLEVTYTDGTLLFNASDAAGNFKVPDVEQERNVSAVVYASNARGRSESRTMKLDTMKPVVASVTEEPTPTNPYEHWIEVTAGFVAIAIAAAISSLCIRAFRARRQKNEPNTDCVSKPDGSFHREPDFAREERSLGTTNITVNQLGPCQNQYSSSPVPSCRVQVGCAHAASQDPCSSKLSYYV